MTPDEFQKTFLEEVEGLEKLYSWAQAATTKLGMSDLVVIVGEETEELIFLPRDEFLGSPDHLELRTQFDPEDIADVANIWETHHLWVLFLGLEVTFVQPCRMLRYTGQRGSA